METMIAEHLLEITQATIKAAEFCFLVTVGESGQPHARLMQPFEPDEDLTIWFGANPQSRMVHEIEKDHRVTLGYGYAPEGAYVTLLGTASLEFDIDKRRQYWRESFAAFWPAGPEGEGYGLIKFVPFQIEMMNIQRGVAPEPYGLQPAMLTRIEGGWVITENKSK